MRTMIGMLTVVGMMAAGAGLARAQDATMMAMQAAQTANQMAMQAAQQANQDAMQATINSGMSLAAARPALPVTPRPVISKLKDGVSVAVYDLDPKAIVFYTTDGSLATLRSQRYSGPIMVSSKVRVRAMAFDLEEMPSGVVSKTVRVKS
jgi:Chitobiase/beta-hexosaminidase C-terminal domain